MKNYTIGLIGGLLTTLLMAASFSWLVNPYDIFNAPEIEGFNLYKVEAERRGRLSKVYQVNRIKPDYITLGSSRALEMPTDYTGNEGLTGLNLSLASGSSYELLRLLQHAHAVHPVKRVVLGVDENFSNSVQPNFIEQRLAVTVDGADTNGQWLAQWQDVFSSLISFDVLRASLATIKKQPAGPIDSYIKRNRKERVERAGGHRQMFRTMESTIMAGYHGAAHECDTVSRPDIDHDRLLTFSFRQMLEMAYANDIDFHIFFSPAHARIYEAMCITGGWPDIENTKRAVVFLVNELADRFGKTPFPVWDFTGYNSITTESLPLPGDKDSLMHWYWEGSHYSEAAAKRVLDRIFSSGEVPGDFGVLISPGNIETHLADIHRQRSRYLDTHASDAAEVRSLLLH